ncbi:isoprenoid synthase domain-containing protein [Biscogniauxia marginata]|nr:isoprenoid synthase domain-containing protein [Biscogniauxia marginata]
MVATQPLSSDTETGLSRTMSNASGELSGLLRPLVTEFSSQIRYAGAKSSCDLDLDRLLQGMREQAVNLGIPYPEGSHSWYCFKLGLYYARFCYPDHPLDVRIYTGIYTWIATLVDDRANKDPEEWQHFILRFQTGAQQHSPLAQAWADYLRLSYKYYSPIAANFIITSSLNFTNANALEASEVLRMTRTAGGEGWPYYLRDKDGVSEAYAWLTFPKSIYPDISRYMEAIPDMRDFISFTNDILSFYKEETAGEKDNYIHIRAFYDGKSVFTTLEDVIRENVDALHRTQVVLQDKGPYAQAWHDHAMGYVTFHKMVERYKLGELGLGENYSDALLKQNF